MKWVEHHVYRGCVMTWQLDVAGFFFARANNNGRWSIGRDKQFFTGGGSENVEKAKEDSVAALRQYLLEEYDAVSAAIEELDERGQTEVE